MGDVTGECMSGGRHWRMYEWRDVTGECMSGGRHWRMYEWGTSLENV